MIMLVSGATATMRRYSPHPHLGVLRTPRCGNSIATITASGLPWACDNDCFQRLDRYRYIRMLKVAAKQPRLLWVTAPDVVGNAAATLDRFALWLPVLRYYQVPVAFVAQDGQEHLPVPWSDIHCLFIGGSTEWKMSEHAEQLILEAAQRGKWVHIGRVNTLRRMWWFSSLPVDSFDGTTFSRWPDRYIPWMLRRLSARQHRLELQ